MRVEKTERFAIQSAADIVGIRKSVRNWAVEIGFGLVDQTKIVTAASELARNTLDYGAGGHLEMASILDENGRKGLNLVFEDNGPGIADIALAMTDGYTSGKGLGLGLSGSKRLMSDFDITTAVGKGTRVSATKWK